MSRAAARAAAVRLGVEYAASLTPPIRLTAFRARPASIAAPHLFVDGIAERDAPTGVDMYQRDPVSVDLVLIHGRFDSGEAVDNADRFADGFLDWVTDHVHEAGENSTVEVSSISDEDGYVADWIESRASGPSAQGPYYATRIALDFFFSR
jgi:hypothetical protein